MPVTSSVSMGTSRKRAAPPMSRLHARSTSVSTYDTAMTGTTAPR